MGGATQVYIRAASLNWQILEEKDKREIPKNLLRKMVKMKIKTEGVKIIDSPPRHHRDVLPLSLVYLSHRYSLSLNCLENQTAPANIRFFALGVSSIVKIGEVQKF